MDKKTVNNNIPELRLQMPDSVIGDLKDLFLNMALEIIREVKTTESMFKPWMTKTEACKAVGVSFSTIQRWIRNEGLKEITVEGKKLISREDLLQFMKEHTN